MKIYISGPMSSIGPPTWNFPAFDEAAKLLVQAGYEVENPADKGVIEGWTWEMYLRYDLEVLLRCDAVATLPDYCASEGALLETHVARKLKMPIRSVEEWRSLPPGVTGISSVGSTDVR